MSVEKIKEYTNGEITIVWKPEKCFHAGNCVSALPGVYKPNQRPWIQVENASSEDLKAQVKTCPSGALTYFMNKNPSDVSGAGMNLVEVLENGPLVLYGSLEIENKDGEILTRDTKTAFCRCGGSSRKPFCDGSHLKNGFNG